MANNQGKGLLVAECQECKELNR
eukprot:COSAG05_NODE_20139_length_282_cov_1.136612_1_plen_22_part_01